LANIAPFKRVNRPLATGQFCRDGRASFYCHPDYAVDGRQFCRSYRVLISDLEKLFLYIDPADENNATFSFEIMGLFIRICIEIEANLKAILQENGYLHDTNLTMRDYRKTEASHQLSQYTVRLSSWRTPQSEFQPFSAWSTADKSLTWYQDYNDVKHSRHEQLPKASFGNLIQAASALTILIWAQFGNAPFTAANTITFNDDWGLGGFVRTATDSFFIKPPSFELTDRYDFDHQDLWQGRISMRSFDYSSVS
jgi:hypothetical protein